MKVFSVELNQDLTDNLINEHFQYFCIFNILTNNEFSIYTSFYIK